MEIRIYSNETKLFKLTSYYFNFEHKKKIANYVFVFTYSCLRTDFAKIKKGHQITIVFFFSYVCKFTKCSFEIRKYKVCVSIKIIHPRRKSNRLKDCIIRNRPLLLFQLN